MLASLPLIGYGLAGAAFLVVALLLVTSWQGGLHGVLLLAASGLSAVWGIVLALAPTLSPDLAVSSAFVAEVLRDGAWLVFLSALFAGGIGGGAGHRVLSYGGPVLAVLVLLAGIAVTQMSMAAGIYSAVIETHVVGSLVLSLFAIVLIEQIYRNARGEQRAGLKFLSLGLAGLFAYDLVLYSHAMLFGQINELFWSVRGIVATFCVPLIAVSASRSRDWAVGIFVSRQVVFHTTTVIGIGVYLILMAAIGYYIRMFGGEWGPAVQAVFFATAILFLAGLLFSDRLRRRQRVFLSKHFFQNRYDYRDEWLRLMTTLASPGESHLPLRKRAIKALCDILESPAGALYLCEKSDGAFRCAAGWNSAESESTISGECQITVFLEKTGWIVDTDEYEMQPEKYEGLEGDLPEFGLDAPGIIVPLMHEERLIGFVVLARSKFPRSLNFEDHDLLKTTGRQIASYLDQEQKTYQLAESRQFEAFNRLTAYLMHDLKNLIAQQSLVVQNAQRHRDNPKFIDDAIRTVENSVQRMKKILEQLRQGASLHSATRVEVGKLVIEAVSQCADRQPEPRADIGDARIWIRADRERLIMALVHAIRNAQEATPADGAVDVKLDRRTGKCVISVIDTGCGMEQEFIDKRLFRPFDSTKGAQGMGIGAYQLREAARASGGDLQVRSQPGEGTCISLSLPLEADVSNEAAASRAL